MKKYLVLAVLLAAAPGWGLSLGKESKQEARLFNQFLKAVYAQREEDPRAFSYLEKALEMDPSSKYLKRLLVSEALAQGNAAKADAYASFIQEGENEAEDWMVYAAYQWKKGNLSEAEIAYEKALKLEPDNVLRSCPSDPMPDHAAPSDGNTALVPGQTAMALEGSTYTEILQHYYTGVTVEECPAEFYPN